MGNNMTEKKPKIIAFKDIQNSLMDELKKRLQTLEIKESVTLVEGFISQPFNKELSTSFVLGGPTIPMVMLLGNESGRIYLFALKALLKDMEL
jgi:hypothetical protein